MSRILVDLPDAQLEALARIAKAERRPRAAVIRDAVGVYVAQRKAAAEVEVFGRWKARQIDGLAYQRELRAEW